MPVVPQGLRAGVRPAGLYNIEGSRPLLAEVRARAGWSITEYAPDDVILPCAETTKAGNPCTSPRAYGTTVCNGHLQAVGAYLRATEADDAAEPESPTA